MGGPGKAHRESMERLRQRIKFGKRHRLLQDGPSLFGGRHFTELPDRSFKVDTMRFIREQLRPISLPRERCLDRSAEASEEEVKALRAVAGSLSWVARPRRPDEAGTASTLQGSVSRAAVKDLSDVNLAVNRLKSNQPCCEPAEKQTEDVGLLIHAIPLINLCTVWHSTWTVQTVRHREASWSVSPRQPSTSKDQQSCHPCPGRRTR